MAANAYSGTLPVLYINTENKTPVTSKETYVSATYYLDDLGIEGYTSIASQDQPDSLYIKGRGNYTWKDFNKKPYRLKLNNKQAMMGLPPSKHWTLLAHPDDQFCWMKNTVGFLLSEQIGLEWTPKQAPVEVVLNGDYIGLYMLTEQVRLDNQRVQGDWLLEIDNYEEEGHLTLVEPSNLWHGEQLVWFTPKDPDASELSPTQHLYLQSQMETLNTALYTKGDQALSAVLDIDEAARFYLVQELMSDCESYHGSCYLHANANGRWRFGPVWDFGNSFRDQNRFIYDHPTWSQVWIGQLSSHQAFQDSLHQIWQAWKSTYYSSISAAIDSFATLIAAAAVADAERWPQYDHSNVQQGKSVFKNYFRTHVTWLTTQWGEATALPATRGDESGVRKVLIDGHLYILREEDVYSILGDKNSIGR